MNEDVPVLVHGATAPSLEAHLTRLGVPESLQPGETVIAHITREEVNLPTIVRACVTLSASTGQVELPWQDDDIVNLGLRVVEYVIEWEITPRNELAPDATIVRVNPRRS